MDARQIPQNFALDDGIKKMEAKYTEKNKRDIIEAKAESEATE